MEVNGRVSVNLGNINHRKIDRYIKMKALEGHNLNRSQIIRELVVPFVKETIDPYLEGVQNE